MSANDPSETPAPAKCQKRTKCVPIYRDEARRIAERIAKLPELLLRPSQPSG